MTVTGKVQKYLLREHAIELLDLDSTVLSRRPDRRAGRRAASAGCARGDGQRDGPATARGAAAVAARVIEPPDDERAETVDARVERAPEVGVVDEAARAVARQPRLLVDGSSGLDRDEIVVEEVRQQA